MSELIKLVKTNLSHQTLAYKVYRIDYDRVLNKISIDGLPGKEFHLYDFADKLREFFKSESRFSTDQAMKARSPRIIDIAIDKVKTNRLYCSFDSNLNIACFCIIEPSDGDISYTINLVGTSSKYQGQGYASNLIKYAENLAIEDNKQFLQLTVYSENYNALRLYKSLGFEEASEGRDMSENYKNGVVKLPISEGVLTLVPDQKRSSLTKKLYDEDKLDRDLALDPNSSPYKYSNMSKFGKGSVWGSSLGALISSPLAISVAEKVASPNLATAAGIGTIGLGSVLGGYLGGKLNEKLSKKEKDMSEKPKQYEIVYESREVPGSYAKRIGHSLVPASIGALAAGLITRGDPTCMAVSGFGSGLLTYLANPQLSHTHYENVPTLREKTNDLSEDDFYTQKKSWYKNPKYMVPLGVAGALYTIGRLSK